MWGEAVPSSYTFDINVPQGYDGMRSATANINLYSFNISGKVVDSPQNVDTGAVIIQYKKYTAPVDNNSVTDLQSLFTVGPHLLGSYAGIGTVGIKGKIEYKTITSNGTYYPYDESSFIQKIVVNVPQIQNETLTNKRIVNTGNYLVSDLMSQPNNYDGISKNSVWC